MSGKKGGRHTPATRHFLCFVNACKCDLSFMAEAAILLAYEEGEEPGLAFLFSSIHKRSSKCPIRLMKLSASVAALACLLVRSKPFLRMATSARSTNPLVSIAALASPLAPPVLSRHKGYLPSKSKTCPFFGGCFCCISWFVWTSHDFFLSLSSPILQWDAICSFFLYAPSLTIRCRTLCERHGA